MTWIEAGGHYNWLMFRDGDAELRKKLKAQSIATAIAMSLFPTYIILGKGEIHFAIGLLLSVTFFCLVAVIAWGYFKFKSNSESFTYMIGVYVLFIGWKKPITKGEKVNETRTKT